MAKFAGIKMTSVSYSPIKKGKPYYISHPKTAAKHIKFGWAKLADGNSEEMVKLVEDEGKALKSTKKTTKAAK